jgi:hypothetical protein
MRVSKTDRQMRFGDRLAVMFHVPARSVDRRERAVAHGGCSSARRHDSMAAAPVTQAAELSLVEALSQVPDLRKAWGRHGVLAVLLLGRARC